MQGVTLAGRVAAMEPRSRTSPAPTDCRIHVLEWSDAGVPLVLLHGFGNEAHI